MTKSEIENNLKVIREEIDREVPTDSGAIETMLDKLNNLSTLIGLSAECKAEAKALLFQKQANHLLVKMRDNNFLKMNWNLQKRLMEGDLWEEEKLLEYADRISAGIIHCGDFLRTIISRNKQEKRVGDYSETIQK